MQKISNEELATVINAIYDYGRTHDKSYLISVQPLIWLARALDYSVKTQAEYDKGCDFLQETHGPSRMAVVLLNTFGEFYCNNGIITIFEDDPAKFKLSHDNTYLLKLKDIDTHFNFYNTNPTPEDEPYDLDTQFIKQITVNELGKATDTTLHAWDSFNKGYQAPVRKFDFKSALWKKGHEHKVQYIIKLDYTGELIVMNRISKEIKKYNFRPDPMSQQYYTKYYELLNKLNVIKQFSWEDCLLEETK